MNLVERAKSFFQGQDVEDHTLAAQCKGEVEKMRSSSSRIAHESVWMTNIAYLLGFDGITWDARTRSYQPVDRAQPYSRKTRLNVNKILPLFQNRLARLCKNLPKFDIPPKSMEEEDKDISRDAMDLVLHLWDDLRLQEKRIELMAWVQQCGHAYLKGCWDPTLGQMMQSPSMGDDGAPKVNPTTGQPELETDWEGDVRAEVISPFEVFPDPLAKSWDDVKRSYLYHCKVRPLKYFVDNYEKGALVKEEDVWLLSLQYEQRINTMNTRGSQAASSTNDAVKNSATEIIKYEAQSKQFPRGRMIISANGILLENKELPAGIMPFCKFDDVRIGGKYNSESLITHERPLQDHYNSMVRKRAEWARRLVNGKYIVARGTNIGQESMNDQSAEMLLYDAVPNAPDGGRPVPIQVPVMPQFAYTETEMAEKDLNEISGLGDVSRGIMPSASIPAKGMEILQEADDSRIAIVTEQHENAMSDFMTIMVSLCSEGYKEPRNIRVRSGQNYNYKQVQGEKLKGIKVLVVKGSTLPGSKVIKREEILNAFDRGLVGPPQDPGTINKVLELVEFGDTPGLWKDYRTDMAQIKRVTDAIYQGQPHVSDEMDNHDMFIKELNELRKTEKFESLNPQIQAMIIDAREQHLQWKMKLMGAPVPDPVAPAHDPSQPIPSPLMENQSPQGNPL